MRNRDKKKERIEIIKALAMITQMGLTMFMCVAIGLALGIWLDRLFGTSFLVIIFLFIGMFAGIRSMFVLLGKKIPWEKNREDSEEKQSVESRTDNEK